MQKNKIRAVQFRLFTPQTQNIVIEFFQILLRDFSLQLRISSGSLISLTSELRPALSIYP
jgi:hypothetical protein